MSKPEVPLDECHWRDTAPVFVLGALSESEHAAYAEHLLEGCGACGAELEEARTAIAALDLASVPPVAEASPRREARLDTLKARLLTEIGERETVRGASDHAPSPPALSIPAGIAGVHMIPASSEGWQETGFEGMQTKRLAVDVERGYATSLVRMAPGTVFPAHRHVGREECYVVSGDLSFGSHRLRAGDYQLAEAGSIHPEHSTGEGCLLLIVASDHDEVLPC